MDDRLRQVVHLYHLSNCEETRASISADILIPKLPIPHLNIGKPCPVIMPVGVGRNPQISL